MIAIMLFCPKCEDFRRVSRWNRVYCQCGKSALDYAESIDTPFKIGAAEIITLTLPDLKLDSTN